MGVPDFISSPAARYNLALMERKSCGQMGGDAWYKAIKIKMERKGKLYRLQDRPCNKDKLDFSNFLF